MKLPIPFFNKTKKEESEYYLALLLTDEKTSAVILKEILGKLQVIGKHEEFFASSLEEASIDELISIIDKTISRAEEVLPPDIETHKTVFGLKENWIDEETKKIKKDYLAKLKKICDSLDLKPMGFMVVAEAISNLLQEEEGAPLSAILAEIGKKTASLSLFRGGKIAEKIDGPLEESASQTVDNLLKHFTTTVLPARIILYDAKDSEKLSQNFINHQWSKSLPFLHVPQVMVLPQGSDAKAVVYGAAEQMGFEVLGNDLKKDGAKEGLGQAEKLGGVKEEEVISDNFGFVKDQDIAEIIPQNKETTEEALPEEKQPFTVNLHQEEDQESEENMEEEVLKKPRIKFKMPKLSLPFGHSRNKNLILLLAVVIGLFILFGGVTYFYFSNVKANIVLSVKPKMVEETSAVTFSSSASSDFSKNIIATKALVTTVKGEMTIDTTGKKDVGDKAKGKVTIYNNGNDSAKLNSGDAIKSSNGLLFTIDKDISVASASGDVFSGTKPGTTEVNVTAKEIGTEYNLPSGTKFTVGNSSTLAAKNDNAFSGGTKKQIQVVSKNDIAKLRIDLPKSLEEKARSEIAKKASSDEVILPFVLTVGFDNEKFDKDVDEEAKKIKLTAEINFQGQAYQRTEMLDFAKALLKSKYSQDIAFAENSIQNSIKSAKATKDKQIVAELVVSAGLLPEINLDEITQKAKQQSLNQTKEMLANQPQVISTQINFSPHVFFLPNLFPKLPNQISIEVKPE